MDKGATETQYSTEPHRHFRLHGGTYEHSHRTWPEFHGHDGLPVLPHVRVTADTPGPKGSLSPLEAADLLADVDSTNRDWFRYWHEQTVRKGA